MFQKLLAFELQTDDFARFAFDPVQLKYTFGDIDTDYHFAIIHLGLSGLPVKMSILHLGYLDAVGS
ncbi:MAG: hypothetical protein ACXWAB_12755 [Methylobacter sp.]